MSANLIQMWLTQFDGGEFSNEEVEASVVADFGPKFAALEREVGQLTMELELVKKTPRLRFVSDSVQEGGVHPITPILGQRSVESNMETTQKNWLMPGLSFAVPLKPGARVRPLSGRYLRRGEGAAEAGAG
ncbi:hypothetical protein [Variovorax paradoxus]|uniref:hypothetical protein n=1 Tax=Variovorax paradoxus TaxID=34073 RepID=UPI00278413CF|nr:hypothetical protein [Variovorax paradoxus]MDP9927988.1 hypothetical protein [Variovorax paradoxus]